MTEYRCEQCENCFMHVENPNCGVALKNCNKRHTSFLLTCAKCKEVRYCSRACQKAQWKEHKLACVAHIRIVAALKFMGPQVERTFKAFTKFSKALSSYMEVPAISALGLHRGKHRVDSNVFFVKIRAKETIFFMNERITKGCVTFKVVSAECKTMHEMHEFLDWRAGPLATPEVTDRTLAHRPGLLRMFVLDISGLLPIPLDGYTLPTDISNWPSEHHLTYNPNWFDDLLDTIGQRGDQPIIMEPLDGLHFHQNNALEEPRIPPARPSSPIDSKPQTLAIS